MNVVRISPLVLLLVGCLPSPHQAKTYDGPESLMQQSREVVSVPLVSAASSKELMNWVKRDAPANVVLQCAKPSAACTAAEKSLRSARIPFTAAAADAGGDMAILSYVRTTAADCDQRVVDTSHNVNNLPSQNVGCAVSYNTVRMINDSKQLTNPGPTGLSDGKKAVGVVESYQSGAQKLSEGSVSASSSSASR